jgi:hypothetical protein
MTAIDDLKFFREQPITMYKPKSEAAQGRDRDQCFQEETRMSSPITASQGPTGARAAVDIRAAGARADDASPTRPQRSVAAQSSVSLQTLPSSPPPEVLEQMADAAQRYDELSSQGRELRFARDSESGRTRIEVRDRAGHLVKTLSPAQALDVAAGGPLD